MEQVIIAASTHWDREWYRTFPDFQIRLCDLFDRLLTLLESDQAFACYTFDGQSVVLEDYLEIHPENKARVQALTQQGRLVFGPLYNLPDEFLAGGEGLIRNFLLGQEVCKDFGGRLRAGYMPDNFGHIAQLPQILQGVGLDTAFFFRGIHMDTVAHKEFRWASPDGSEVLCEYMPLGYWSLKSWGKLGNPAEEHFRQAYETLRKDSALGIVLLINGSDHLYQDPDFSGMVAKVKETFPSLSIRNGSIADYADLMVQAAKENPALKRVTGELRDFRYGPDPTAVTSTRGSLKRLLFATQAELERYAEPLAVLAGDICDDYTYPQGFFTKCWKQMCVSLGHDGITGCATDEVIRDITTYLRHCGETAARISELALEQIGQAMGLSRPAEGEQHLLIFNPHPFAYTGMIRQTICLERGESLCKEFSLCDLTGQSIPFELTRVWEDVITREFFYHSKEKIYRDCFDVLFAVENLPPLGVRAYRVKKLPHGEKRERELFVRLAPSRPQIENEYFLVRPAQDGSLHVTDKRTGRQWQGLNQYISRGEAGDEYQHVSPLLDRHVFAQMTGCSVVHNSPLSQTLQIRAVLAIPVGATSDLLGRQEQTVPCPIITEVTLCQNQPIVSLRVSIDNPAADQILFARFPVCVSDATDYSYVSFAETKRDQALHAFDPALKSTQSILKPMQGYAGVVGKEDGLHVMAKGIYEYHTKQEGDDLAFYLTLLRSTSYMFHGLPISWLDGQHSTTPIVRTPDAQELGCSVLEYALAFGTETVAPLAQAYLYPPRGYNLPPIPKTASVQTEREGLHWDNDAIGLSALKRHKDGEGVVVRLFNRTGENQPLTLHTPCEIAQAFGCDLLEQPQETLAADMAQLSIELAPHQIKTIWFHWR